MINYLNSFNKQYLPSDLKNQTRRSNHSSGLKLKQNITSDVFEPSFRSNKPENTTPKKYIVLDSASLVKDVDVDGDDENDLTHIETVKRLIKSNEPDAEILSYAVKCNRSDQMIMEDLLEKLNEILDYVKSNKVDGVNISCGRQIDFKSIRQARENFEEMKVKLYTALEDQLDTNSSDGLKGVLKEDYVYFQAIKIIEQIIETGTKVFIAAGNKGAGSFNLLSFAKGAISVGALDGQKNKMTLSADHSDVVFEKGSFAVTKVERNGIIEGYDLDNNGTIDVKPDEVSNNGQSVVKQFAGQPLENCLITDKEFEVLEIFQKFGDKIPYDNPKTKVLLEKIYDIVKNKLMTVDQYAQMHNIKPFSTSCLKDKGSYMTYKSQKVFDSGKDGLVVYNPDRSNAQNVVSEFSGTSFASPIKMVRG